MKKFEISIWELTKTKNRKKKHTKSFRIKTNNISKVIKNFKKIVK